MMRTVFVILHYMTIEDTVKCARLIQEYATNQEYHIIIIDNASPNGSGLQLKNIFREESTIETILLEHNIGFAKGNNVGYKIAIEKYSADFVIMLNNDVEIYQSDFVATMIEIYQKEKFHILGPDIINLDGKHQNPHRKELFTQKRVKRLIINRTIIRCYLEIKKILHIEDKLQILEKMDANHAAYESKDIDSTTQQEEIVLQGSCYIFSPLYLKENTFAFYPETFMYLEEEILAYLCKEKDYKVIYSPALRVTHKEASSTKQTVTPFNQSLFYTIHLKDSAKILYRLMKMKSDR